MTIIPFMVAGIYIFNLVKEIMFNAYPGVIPGAVSAIMLICLFSYYWSGILSKTDIRHLTNTDILSAGKHFNLLSVRK